MTLAQRDTSGTFAVRPGELGEVVSRRTSGAKVFALPDAPDGRKRFRVGAGVGPVHYRAEPWDEAEEWKERDLTIRLTPTEAWDAELRDNGYQVRLWQSRAVTGGTIRYVAQFRRALMSFGFAPLALLWTNTAGQRQLISRTVGGIAPVIDNDAYTVTWADAFGPGLDYRVNCRPDEFFKTLIIRTKASLPAPTIGLAGLQLTLVLATTWNAATAQTAGVQDCAGGDLQYSDDISGTPDAAVDNPGLTEMRRADARAAFYLQKPRAWDSSEEPKDVALSCRIARWGTRTVTILRCPATALNATGVVYPVYMDTAIGEEQVGASADDAYSYSTTWPGTRGSYNVTGTTLYLGARPAEFRCSGARFQTVPIPVGATIDSAAVTVIANANTSVDTDVTWWCDDHDDAAAFADSANVDTGAPGNRTRTTASVQWDIGTTAWTAGTEYDSPDLKTAVQEVIDRVGWAEDNDLAVIVAATNTSLPASDEYRLVRSWDYTGNTSGPMFNATYTAAGGGIVYGVIGSPIVTGIIAQSRVLRGDVYRA